MRMFDTLFAVVIVGIAVSLALPAGHHAFVAATLAVPYLMGFVKFAVLATMGELLAIRIVYREWRRPTVLALRAIVWGVLGIVITFVFRFFAGGVAAAQASGQLPTVTGVFAPLLSALFVSGTMNLTFGPVLMIVHRLSDTYFDLRFAPGSTGAVSLAAVVAEIDWKGLVGFVLFRTIPFFWIPAHTITFLLPGVYRVLAAAALSLVLGVILAFSKRSSPR